MKKSFKHLLMQPLVWIYLMATAIGNTSFLYSVFSIFMLAGFAVFTGSIVGIVIGIGLLALHHSISKRFVFSKIGIAFSWMGILLIMGLSVVGWFLIFHHVTFGIADMQYRKQIIIEREFQRIESSNDELINSLKKTYQEGYLSAAKGYHPKTLGKADTSIQNLVSKKFYIDQQTVNEKLAMLFEDDNSSNVLLSFVTRFRENATYVKTAILLFMLALLISPGIDVCSFAFNRVEKKSKFHC